MQDGGSGQNRMSLNVCVHYAPRKDVRYVWCCSDDAGPIQYLQLSAGTSHTATFVPRPYGKN